MIKAHIKYQGKKEHFLLPTSIEELTIKTFIDLIDYYTSDDIKKNDMYFLNALTGIEINILKQCEPKSLLKIYENIGWINEDLFTNIMNRIYEVKSKINIAGIIYDVPQNIELETFEQFVYCKQIIESNQKKYKSIASVIACYMYKNIYVSDFNGDKIDDLVELISNEPVLNLWGLYDFFLYRFLMQSENYKGLKYSKAIKNHKQMHQYSINLVK